jgi:predicted nucleotidyltransferase
MKRIDEILRILTVNKSRLLDDYPIRSIAVFGSYARSEQNGDSDVDIMVEFKDKIGIRFIDLADEIEEIVGIKVDLVSRKAIKDKYFESIKTDLIYV